MSYISRSLESVVESVTKEYPVVLVTGPRQVGKTTMLQKLMIKMNYIMPSQSVKMEHRNYCASI